MQRVNVLVTAVFAAAILVSLVVLLEGGQPAQAQSGGRLGAQIIRGSPVPNGKYPFMVALLDTRRGTTPFDQQFCGGTLIDNNSVLTAAHCVRNRDFDSVQELSHLDVSVGRTLLNSNQGQRRNVITIGASGGFNNRTNAFDVAVLKLDSPVSGIAPIRVATPAHNFLETPGRFATVAGWGTFAPSEPFFFPFRMREGRAPIRTDKSGLQIYRDYLPTLMILAGGSGTPSICFGDSGGPLFARVASGRYVQIGITSFTAAGHGCGEIPAGFTEVNNPTIRSFITSAASR
jgi:secreted trypsin-like serine protease